MDWWPIVVVALGGAAALVVAAVVDRRRRRQLAEAAAAPPKRHLPALAEDAAPPAYVSEADALTPPADRSVPGQVDVAQLEASEALPGGWADRAFVTDSERGWAVVSHPYVLACTGVGSFRELLPAVTAAKRANRGLVVVAPAIEPVALRTLTANAVQGHLPCVVVLCADTDQVARIAEAVGASVVRREHLQSGWVPTGAYGACDTWVSSARQSWALSKLST